MKTASLLALGLLALAGCGNDDPVATTPPVVTPPAGGGGAAAPTDFNSYVVTVLSASAASNDTAPAIDVEGLTFAFSDDAGTKFDPLLPAP